MVEIAVARRALLTVERRIEEHLAEVAGSRLHHAAVDRLSLTGATAVEEADEGGRRHLHARDRVHLVEAHDHRVAVGIPVKPVPAGKRLDRCPVRLVVAQGPGLAEAGPGRHHEARVSLRELGPLEPEPLHDPRREVLHHHVGAGCEAPEHVPALRGLEVQAQGALVPVDAVVVRDRVHQVGRWVHHWHRARQPPPPDVRPAVRFDLDHVGAEIGQQHGGERTDPGLRQVDDLDSGQRQRLAFPAARRRMLLRRPVKRRRIDLLTGCRGRGRRRRVGQPKARRRTGEGQLSKQRVAERAEETAGGGQIAVTESTELSAHSSPQTDGAG